MSKIISTIVMCLRQTIFPQNYKLILVSDRLCSLWHKAAKELHFDQRFCEVIHLSVLYRKRSDKLLKLVILSF